MTSLLKHVLGDAFSEKVLEEALMKRGRKPDEAQLVSETALFGDASPFVEQEDLDEDQSEFKRHLEELRAAREAAQRAEAKKLAELAKL
eukprot:7179162-Pyramimonas_sp.AAC.1